MTTHPLQAVLFDLDGTLLDTAPDFIAVVNQQRQRHQLPALEHELIRATVSHGARALTTLSFGLQPDQPGFEEKRQELLDLYADHLAVYTTIFPGINEVLGWLEAKNLPWGIVTNKPRQYAEEILTQLTLHKRYHTLVCPDDVTHTKPNAEPMLLACTQINCSPAQTIYLGDHRRDIEAGRNAGMKTIAVNYGYIDPDDPASDWQADYYVDHASEIVALLESRFHLTTPMTAPSH